jgi:hypothetical protein
MDSLLLAVALLLSTRTEDGQPHVCSLLRILTCIDSIRLLVLAAPLSLSIAGGNAKYGFALINLHAGQGAR